ncbi:MAG TPA: 4-(cytidine 5'-diphospho)-2-C-methyl-D-erythritol kinase [Acidimicrobiales bacterium]|nr:4-(cytidine 5'-diphospho)-2-C-methyl-D-erythritol kinase [Acidimicrobiales bacterium]
MPDPGVHREHAYAKLTRNLRVLGRALGGLHALEAEMITLDLCDDLEITPRSGSASEVEVVDEVRWRGFKDSLGGSPVVVPADGTNLVARALVAVGRSAAVRLTKRIPAGGGLGGGSADAGAVLRWAGVTEVAVASSLGSDVPFCVAGGRALVSGAGEAVEPMPFELVHVVLVTPRFGVSTAAVYGRWDDIGGPRSESGNDLAPAALLVDPRLEWWRSFLASVAGRDPVLAGSGSTWFFECGSAAAAVALADQIAVGVGDAGTRAFVHACRSIPSATVSAD